MAHKILVLYGSYRSDRMGIRLADFIVARLRARGDSAELIDAKEVGLPMLDRMYKEYPPGSAPPALHALAEKIRGADAFVFVVGEYNWGVQPGLKNLTDHFLEEWFGRPPRSPAIRGTSFRGEVELRLAQQSVRNGHGGDLERAGGRSDRADPGCGRRSLGPRGKGAGTSVPEVRRRPRPGGPKPPRCSGRSVRPPIDRGGENFRSSAP